MLFQWRNSWPLLMSGGIQNPVVSTWPSPLGHQPPVSAILDISHFMLDPLCQHGTELKPGMQKAM